MSVLLDETKNQPRYKGISVFRFSWWNQLPIRNLGATVAADLTAAYSDTMLREETVRSTTTDGACQNDSGIAWMEIY
jgi:hypothetical protein